MSNVPLVISHANCWDGAAAAWVAKKFFKDECEIKFAQYGDAAPTNDEVQGRTVYILDFSYPKADLERIDSVAAFLKVLDHHHTAKENLEGLDCCQFDMTKSGCRLAWDHFFGEEDVPNSILRIEDRDLWKWQIPGSKEILATLTGQEPTIENFERFDLSVGSRYSEDEDFLCEQGDSLLSFFDRIYASAHKNAFYRTLLGYKVLFVQSTGVLASELGNYCAERSESSIACVFNVKTDNVTLSFRTVNGVDATPIAKYYGGGGHKAACGAVMSHDQFNFLLKPLTFEVMP